MEEMVEWRRRRITRAGVLVYEIFREPGADACGARIRARGQRVQVCDVTADRLQLERWMRRMAKGGVRPCHLRDILEELLLAEQETL